MTDKRGKMGGGDTMNPRMKFMECLGNMWEAFRSGVPTDRKEEIERFVEAKDTAQGLLSSICTKGLDECLDCNLCSGEKEDK
jgi:hypothetical protein